MFCTSEWNKKKSCSFSEVHFIQSASDYHDPHPNNFSNLVLDVYCSAATLKSLIDQMKGSVFLWKPWVLVF